MSSYLADVIAGMANSLRENSHGWSCLHTPPCKDPWATTICVEDWNQMLLRLEFGLRFSRWAEEEWIHAPVPIRPVSEWFGPTKEDGTADYVPTTDVSTWLPEVNRREQVAKQVTQEALQLLVQHWESLWD